MTGAILVLIGALAGAPSAPRARAAEQLIADLHARAEECADRARHLSGPGAAASWRCVLENADEARAASRDLPSPAAAAARFDKLVVEASSHLGAAGSDVDEDDDRLAGLQRNLADLRRAADDSDRDGVTRLLRRMRSDTASLEREALSGRRSVSARALLAEAEDIAQGSGVQVADADTRPRRDPQLARMEARRRALERELAAAERDADPAAQERADNLRGDLMELSRRMRLRGW